MRFLFVFLMSLALSGCVGAVVLHSPERAADPMQVALGGRGYLLSTTKGRDYTKAEVRAKWGEPDQVHRVQGEERWVYKRDLAWLAIVPVVVIPIPLGVPVAREHAILSFAGEKLVGVTARERALAGGVCGFFLMSDTPRLELGCISF